MELTKFPNHNIFIEQANYGVQNYLIVEFVTKDNRLVYMKHPISRHPHHEIKLVFIQAQKFLTLWQNSQCPQESHLSFGSEIEWRQDYKFHHAEKGFNIGRTNPVPLAEISCTEYIKSTPIYEKRFIWFKKLVGYSEENIVACSFINGITRTIWLLANGINQFPVYVYDEESAILLAKHAGITQSSFYDLAELNSELEELVKEEGNL